MFRRSYLFPGAVVCLLALAWIARSWFRPPPTPVPLTDGITRALAADRASTISSLKYELSFFIPPAKETAIRGREIVRFNLADASRPLVLDFSRSADQITSLTIENRSVPIESIHGHLVIPPEALRRGENAVTIEFIAGDLPLNRNDDFLYSLFVPARASQTFPCFDQPDLKASFALTLEVPSGWEAVANGFEVAHNTTATSSVIRFAPTPPLPTYLFAFAAGKFSVERGERNGRPFRLYHRETDAAKVARNAGAIFDLHEQAIEWLEAYTARKYPFEKMDFVLIPAFQFGGMEHAGAILYNASSMFLDESATQEQELARASTIAHETSHMWFGDLVTMKWFDDVWLKEVFANFMAAKIVNPSFPAINHELRFLLQHYPSAYDIDRTPGANPIRQRLDNLSEAGSLYGPIIYDKAPIVMRQLETIVGSDGLRDGLREYLARFAFHNATWSDLIAILDAKTAEDLASWSHVWVDEPGRPTITTHLEKKSGAVERLAFTQEDPKGRSLVWNQRMQLAMGYENGTRITPLAMNASRVEAAGAKGLPEPLYVLPNGEGVGYGLFKLDEASRSYLIHHLTAIGDAITRGTGWLTIWDDMLEGGVPPSQLLDLALAALPLEHEEQITQRILGYTSEAFWLFLHEADRDRLAPAIERVLRAGIRESEARSLKAAYFSAFRRMATTPDGIAYLQRVWSRKEMVAGLPLAEPDYIAMAQELAVRGVPTAASILSDQLGRIENPDRKARFAFITPALSPDESTRDRFFESLAAVENRRHEPWVIDALAYLNHPLRARHAERYIRPSLDLLQDIQRTGDIFFPSRWTDAALGGHNSPEAARTVADFLATSRNYPSRLRQIVEQSSDTLVRSSRILSAGR